MLLLILHQLWRVNFQAVDSPLSKTLLFLALISSAATDAILPSQCHSSPNVIHSFANRYTDVLILIRHERSPIATSVGLKN